MKKIDQTEHEMLDIPSGVLAATAARSISPVARWHRQNSFLMAGDWVPFPHPGGPGTQSMSSICAQQSALASLLVSKAALGFVKVYQRFAQSLFIYIWGWR